MKRDEELMCRYELLFDDLGDLPYPIIPPIASLFLRWLEEEEYSLATGDDELVECAYDEGISAKCAAKRFVDAIVACDATLAELEEWVADHGMPDVTNVFRRPEPEFADIQEAPNLDVKAIKESLADEALYGWVYRGRTAIDWYRLYQRAVLEAAKLANELRDIRGEL